MHFPPMPAPVKFRSLPAKHSPGLGYSTIMRLTPSPVLLGVILLASSGFAQTVTPPVKLPATPTEVVWEAQLQNFDAPIYEREVETLMTQFESTSGRHLVPGAKKK